MKIQNITLIKLIFSIYYYGLFYITTLAYIIFTALAYIIIKRIYY